MQLPQRPVYSFKDLKVGDRVRFREAAGMPWSAGVWTLSDVGPGFVFITGGTFGMSVPLTHVCEVHNARLGVPQVRELTADAVTFTLSIEPEQDDPADHFEDPETLTYVREQISAGNEWAWCAVTVTARWGDFETTASICGCSYASAEDFKAGGYYADLCTESLAALNAKIAQTFRSLQPLLSTPIGV